MSQFILWLMVSALIAWLFLAKLVPYLDRKNRDPNTDHSAPVEAAPAADPGGPEPDQPEV